MGVHWVKRADYDIVGDLTRLDIAYRLISDAMCYDDPRLLCPMQRARAEIRVVLKLLKKRLDAAEGGG